MMKTICLLLGLAVMAGASAETAQASVIYDFAGTIYSGPQSNYGLPFDPDDVPFESGDELSFSIRLPDGSGLPSFVDLFDGSIRSADGQTERNWRWASDLELTYGPIDPSNPFVYGLMERPHQSQIFGLHMDGNSFRISWFPTPFTESGVYGEGGGVWSRRMPDQTPEVVISEPASALLVIGGVLGAAMMRRRHGRVAGSGR